MMPRPVSPKEVSELAEPKDAALHQRRRRSTRPSSATSSKPEISVVGRANGWVVIEKDTATPSPVIKARPHRRLDEALADAARALTAAKLLPDYNADLADSSSTSCAPRDIAFHADRKHHVET